MHPPKRHPENCGRTHPTTTEWVRRRQASPLGNEGTRPGGTWHGEYPRSQISCSLRPQIKSPTISSFSLPSTAPLILSFTLLVVYLYFSPPTNTLQSILGPSLISFTFWTLVTLHSLEALYTFYLCRNHSTGIVLGVSTSYSFTHMDLNSSCRPCMSQQPC
jgi:hypothetical protein